MSEKMIGYCIFNESKGDYLAKFINNDDFVLRGFGSVDLALVYSTIDEAKEILVECNSDCSVVRIYKNEGVFMHKTIT